MTTQQKASSPSPVRSERHVRELRWNRDLIFGLIRLRSPTFIGVQINAAMQVADLNGIRRTIIQTSENRKVGGPIPPCNHLPTGGDITQYVPKLGAIGARG